MSKGSAEKASFDDLLAARKAKESAAPAGGATAPPAVSPPVDTPSEEPPKKTRRKATRKRKPQIDQKVIDYVVNAGFFYLGTVFGGAAEPMEHEREMIATGLHGTITKHFPGIDPDDLPEIILATGLLGYGSRLWIHHRSVKAGQMPDPPRVEDENSAERSGAAQVEKNARWLRQVQTAE